MSWFPQEAEHVSAFQDTLYFVLVLENAEGKMMCWVYKNSLKMYLFYLITAKSFNKQLPPLLGLKHSDYHEPKPKRFTGGASGFHTVAGNNGSRGL